MISWFFLGGLVGSLPVLPPPLPDYLGPGGIQGEALYRSPWNLQGRKITLGQMEVGRPVQFLWDKLGRWQPPYRLAGLYQIDRLAPPNRFLESHAGMVAQMMISQDKRTPGVAPQARLHALAIAPLQTHFQPHQCVAAQFLMQRTGGDMAALNLSYGESLERDKRPRPRLDGQSLLSLCLDWLSTQHRVTVVVAGNQGRGGIPIPTDHYNGLTVAYSRGHQGRYDRLAFANLGQDPPPMGRRSLDEELNEGGRNGVHVVAPGGPFALYDVNGRRETVQGTSFAAPLVTGTLALLQEYGDRQGWTAARQPEVRKAILLNSAVKYHLPSLGMTYTLTDQRGKNWLSSPAYADPRRPLDPALGSGQLSAQRALRQLQSGPQTPGLALPAIAWSRASVDPAQSHTYGFRDPLQGGHFATITLVWPRFITLEDTNANGQYDLGEFFQARPLGDLDLALVNVTDHRRQTVCRSHSRRDNVEHLFCPIPRTGFYHIQVIPRNVTSPQPYALSWWLVTDGKPESND